MADEQHDASGAEPRLGVPADRTFPSYRTPAALAVEFNVPLDVPALVAQQMATAGDDPYVRTNEGEIVGLSLRTTTGHVVVNAALTPEADAAIGQHIRGLRPAVRDCQECHWGPPVDDVKPVTHKVRLDGASYFVCEDHAETYDAAPVYELDESVAAEWSAEDCRAAINDGWDIFGTGDDQRPYQLHRVESVIDAWFEQVERSPRGHNATGCDSTTFPSPIVPTRGAVEWSSTRRRLWSRRRQGA